MELNDFKTYLAIGIVGLVVGILYLILQDDLSKTLAIFFITLYIIVSLRYILERRHYKKHKAILASTQFLLLPFSIILMGNYISPLVNDFFTITIDISFNLVSLSLIAPVVILTFHFNNYYSRKWPAIAIRRKVNKRRSIPLLIHSVFVFTILLGFFINGQIDLISLIFTIIYLVFIFRYFIFVRLIKSERRTVIMSSSSPSRSSTRARTSSTTSRRSSSQTSRSRQISSTTRTRTAQSASRARRSSAKIAPGIEIATRKKTRKSTKTTKTTVRDFFPNGKASKDEVKCIICFMEFEKKETRKVILCPHCKYPAHEDEFRSWYQNSKYCARCNKAISTSYVRNPKYRITAKIYIERVIEKL